jgi:hypothetical protein
VLDIDLEHLLSVSALVSTILKERCLLLHEASSIDYIQRLLLRTMHEWCVPVHGQVLSQAALMEFKSGDAERGRGVFEGILRNYPKRLDLWSIYLDQVGFLT